MYSHDDVRDQLWWCSSITSWSLNHNRRKIHDSCHEKFEDWAEAKKIEKKNILNGMKFRNMVDGMARRPFNTNNLIGHSETRTQNLGAIYATCVYGVSTVRFSPPPERRDTIFCRLLQSTNWYTFIHFCSWHTAHLTACPLAKWRRKEVKTQSTADQPQSLRLWQTQYFHLLGYSHCDSNAGLLCTKQEQFICSSLNAGNEDKFMQLNFGSILRRPDRFCRNERHAHWIFFFVPEFI